MSDGHGRWLVLHGLDFDRRSLSTLASAASQCSATTGSRFSKLSASSAVRRVVSTRELIRDRCRDPIVQNVHQCLVTHILRGDAIPKSIIPTMPESLQMISLQKQISSKTLLFLAAHRDWSPCRKHVPGCTLIEASLGIMFR